MLTQYLLMLQSTDIGCILNSGSVSNFCVFDLQNIAQMNQRRSQFWTQQKRGKKDLRGKKSRSKGKSENKHQVQTVTYMVISDEEGAVHIPYQVWADPIKSLIKGGGATWCPVFKVWKIPRVQLQFIKRDLPQILTAQFLQPPSFVKLAIRPLAENMTIFTNKYHRIQYQISSHPLYARLYPFQRQTLQYALSRHGRILIGDEMGIGKSVQSLACCLLFQQAFPLLIICPSSLKHLWKDQVLKWLLNIIKPAQIAVIKKGSLKPGELQNIKIAIASYQIASKLTEELTSFQSVICDEAHYLKNSQTARSSQLVPFLVRQKRVFLLTGTPALAKPKQLFNLMKILRPDLFRSLDEFGQRYCEKKMNQWTRKMEYDGAKNMAQLHYLLKKTVMIRRLKSDVLQQLPSKQRQIVIMQTEKSVVDEIKEILGSGISATSLRQSDKLVELFGNGSKQSGESGSIMRCYMLSARAKIQSVKQYISSILENDIKVIIFAHHKYVMDQLQLHLKSLKYHFIRLDGEVSPETRKKKVDLFQEDSSIKVALLSVTAMGTGFTLTAASTVIFAQLHWTPAILMQAEDRSHRIGQKNSVNIHYLIGNNTLDPIMLRQLQRKIGTVAKVLDGQTETMNIEVLAKGEMGSFQVQNQQIKTKTNRITDYFKPLQSKETQNIEMAIQQELPKFSTQELICREQKEIVIDKNKEVNKVDEDEDSDDSCMMQFIRSRHKVQKGASP